LLGVCDAEIGDANASEFIVVGFYIVFDFQLNKFSFFILLTRIRETHPYIYIEGFLNLLYIMVAGTM
jgi:hypothetical protein